MLAYVINLDARSDRWSSVLSQAELLGMPTRRVRAITVNELTPMETEFAAPGVAATWRSHQKAALEFLSTNDDFALILEDDFHLDYLLRLPRPEWLTENQVDFLQVGYLRVTKWESIDIHFINIRDFILKLIKRFTLNSRFLASKFASRLLIRELPSSQFKLVPSDIRPGGHCYLVSRHFAESMQLLNNPIIFSADELFVSISKMRAFKMMRFKKSQVSQNNLPSSVTERYKLN